MTERDNTPRGFAHRLQGRPSLTAEAVCMARAVEHLKPADRRVVDDPYAELFLSAPSRAALRAWSGSFTARILRRLGPGGTTYVPLRHRFIDDRLVAALDDGAAQVVLLGSGYDTRAYRFVDRLDGRPVFEVDLPAISRSKAQTIARYRSRFPDTTMVRVEIDFERQTLEEVLDEAGFEIGAKTFWAWEGVPMYLTRDAVKATLDSVRSLSGPGSRIAFDMWHLVDDPGPAGVASRIAPSVLSVIGEPVTFSVHPEEVGYFLGQRGLEITELARASDLQERYSPGTPAAVDASMYVLEAAVTP